MIYWDIGVCTWRLVSCSKSAVDIVSDLTYEYVNTSLLLRLLIHKDSYTSFDMSHVIALKTHALVTFLQLTTHIAA